jgi:glycosyltransferase involved in cell wall biosynthesis
VPTTGSAIDGPIWVVLRSLERGGAERQAVVLACALREAGCDVTAFVFYADGSLEGDLAAAGIPVVDLGKRSRWHVVTFVVRFLARARRDRPSWVVPYMTAPNLLAAGAGAVVPGLTVTWNIAGAQRDPRFVNRLERVAERVQVRMATWADAIVVNSEAGRQRLLELGYPETRTITVRNGVDLAAFTPRPERREVDRRALGLGGKVAFGVVGRLHAVKGHRWAIEALPSVLEALPDALLVCVGRGTPAERAVLDEVARGAGVGQHVRWVDQQADVQAVLNALDVIVVPSESEGLPNVLLEAMACGVPAVVTDVGDSAAVVGSIGEVVAPRDAPALAAAMVAMGRRAADPDVRAATRARVASTFGHTALRDRTTEVFRAHRRSPGRRRPG